jgi:hypothetical protein
VISEDDPHRRIATIRIGDIVPSKEDECVLDEAVQKLVGNVRTDLDTFSGEEVHAVIQHGWELARQVVSDQTGLTVDSKRSIEWLPAKRDVTQDQMVDRLRTSGARKFYWRPLFSFRDTAVAALVSIPVCFLLLYAMFNLLGWHILNHARYKQLVDIEAGQVGVLSRWWYNLDKEVALVEVQSSKMPEVVGRSYVIVVMRMPTDGTSLREETKTVVSKVQKFQGIGGTVVEDHVPCARFANSVFYGDAMLFYLYVIPDEKILAMQHAIDMQTDQPLTVDRITKEFGGIRLGGGIDQISQRSPGEKTSRKIGEPSEFSIHGRNENFGTDPCERLSGTRILFLILCHCLFLKIVRPPLHHLPAFRQVLSVIVSRPDAVPFAVSELALDDVRPKPVLIQNRAGGTTEAVAGRARMIAHAIQGVEDGILAHECCGRVLVGEHILPMAGLLLQFPQNRDRLVRQRNDVQFFHLHAIGGYPPLGFVPIDFGPLSSPQLVRADERQQQETERQPGLLSPVIAF